MHPQNGEISFFPPFKLVVSSAVEQFISDLVETLIKFDLTYMGKQQAQVNSISVHKSLVPLDKVQVKMLSPMVAYSTRITEGKKRTDYYSPWEPRFREVAQENLLRRNVLCVGNLCRLLCWFDEGKIDLLCGVSGLLEEMSYRGLH